jgi:hypothetical protein
MATDIVKAQEELFESLKMHREVVGASVRGRAGSQYIVILLSRLTDKINSRIPTEFQGNKVIFEITGRVHAQKSLRKSLFRKIFN